MKKTITAIVICTLAFVLVLTGCNIFGGGKVSNVKTRQVASDIYSEKDIEKAIAVIKKEFKSWSGCELKEIYYAGDDVSADHQEFAERYGTDEVLVLLSTFSVDSSGGDGSLNPNSTYDGWKWILVRNQGGKWKHVDHGYG